MGLASRRRSRHRRGRGADPYEHFYDSYYGLERADYRSPRHHLSIGAGAAIAAGVAALVRRRTVLIPLLSIAVVGILATGLTVSATRTGSDPARSPSLVDESAAPERPGPLAAGGMASHAAFPPKSSSPRAARSTIALVAPVGGGAVNTPAPAFPTTAASRPASDGKLGTTAGHTTSSSAPAPSRSSSTPKPAPSSTQTQSPTPTSSPTPTKSCLVPNPLKPGQCMLHDT